MKPENSFLVWVTVTTIVAILFFLTFMDYVNRYWQHAPN